MVVNFCMKMWCFSILCPLLVAGAQTLSIDSQLGTSIEDCFERISIGEQLPPSAIYRNVSELTTRECEQICKQDKQCQAYDYGVGAKGNATCNLSNLGEKEMKDENTLLRHPDYDVYVRRIQCEQGPPSPLQPLQDEIPGPEHRPVIRPEVDDPRRPPADDFPPDLRPFESMRPNNFRPYLPDRPHSPPYLSNMDRPDDYNSQGPVFDAPPSYGLHRPQDIPFRPHDVPSRPQRPYNYSDPYDVLQFQDGRPPHMSWRPDPHYPPRPNDDIPDLYGQKPVRPLRPELPPHRPEQPEFIYINRPNRKPLRPQEDFGAPGYGSQPSKPLDYPTKPNSYAPNYFSRPPYKLNRPTEYPYRPNERPSYDYNSQYASNYGQNQYDDNSIYVEIYDPPRPYRPNKPLSDRPNPPVYSNEGGYGQNYGYGVQSDFSSYGGQNSYSQNSQSYYGTITQLDNNNRPQHNRPYDRPSYDKPQDTPNSDYGVQNPKPNKPYDRPTNEYGVTAQDVKPNKPAYGSFDSTQSIGYSQTSQGTGYGSSQAGQLSQNTGYGSSQNSPSSQNTDHATSLTSSGYGSSQSSGYGSTQSGQSSSYGQTSQVHGQSSGYGSTQRPHDIPKPGYNDRPSYQSSPGGQGSYGSQNDFSSQSYGGSYQDYAQSYGSQSYGSYQGSYGNRPVNDRPYGNRPLYEERPQYDSQSSYGNRPTNDRPGYYNRPAFDRPAYGEKPNDDPPTYQKPTYDEKPGYGQKPTNEKPVYNQPNYDDTPSYDNNRPDGELGPDFASEGYKNNVKNSTKHEVKPVYEYEVEKPSNAPSYIVRPSGEVITSRPVAIGDYGTRPLGREPVVSYKACFRRVLAGKRAVRSYVRRVVPCERLEDCRRECAEERRFHCESFNYRLDPSFRGKGLCEMMTKPIEAFNLRRDFVEDKEYDFYELDRNSLEPHCPETLRGPGMLHSGYLSSKENYQSSWDRNDYSNRGYDRNQFYDERRPYHGGGRRRYEDQFFVPYQIGQARSNEDQDDWGQYGGSYGKSYYKDRNDYHKSISHWGLNDLEPPPAYGVRPLVNQNFNYYDLGKNIDRYGYGAWKRGRWNVSGPPPYGLESEESTYIRPPVPVYYESGERSSEERSGEVVVKDCSSRRRPGMSLGSGAIRRSLYARTVVQCEAACFTEREFKCVSYSYRYSKSHGSDNCFLSERPYRGLELSADSGSDVYAMPEEKGCPVSYKPFVESECFWHVRSGAAVSDTAAKAALTVAGLGACEAECIRAHAFFCRGFSFRFDSPTIGEDIENCILTSTPPTSLETGRGLRPNAGHELYARGNYGRGCEPALYDDVQQHTESGECYLQYDNAAKLIGSAVKGSARVKDERSCGKACTDAPFRCLSFSFNNNAPGTDNCLLSEIRLFDLQRVVDYEHSTDDWLFAFDLFNGQCWRKVHEKGDYDSPVPELPRPLSPGKYPTPGLSGPSGSSHSVPSGPLGPPSSGTGHGYLPSGPAEPPYTPSGPPSSNYKPSYPDRRPEYQPNYPPSEYLPAEPGYEPSGPHRPSGRPSGPSYLPTGGGNYPPSGPYRPSVPYTPPRRPDYSDTSYGQPLPAPPAQYPPGPGRDSYEYGSSGPQYGPSGPPGVQYGPAGPPEVQYRPAGPPTSEIQYGPSGPPGPDPYGPGPQYGPGGSPGLQGHRGPPREDESMSWRHYTVSGFPCRQGTSCARNQITGHWSCEPEGGEIGSWDYCCAPTHRCGYSEGFHKPWCYVGPSKDQWRPCSEKYYPYHQHNIPHPSQGNRGPEVPLTAAAGPLLPGAYERPADLSYLPEADRRYWDDLYNNGPKAYYDKYGNPLPGFTRVPTAERPHIKYQHNYPRPGGGSWVPVTQYSPELDPPVPGGLGVSRYWPVAYLHKGPPPNTTYFKYNQTEQPSTDRNDQRPFLPSRDTDSPRYPPRDRDNNNRDPFRDRHNSRDPPRDDSRYHDNNKETDSSRDATREPPRDRDFNRDPTRDYNRDPYRDFARDPARDYNRDPSRGSPRDPSSDLVPREPPRDRSPPRERPSSNFPTANPDKPANNNIENKNNRDEKTMNVTGINEDVFNVNTDKVTSTTPKVETTVANDVKVDNNSEVETVKSEDKPTKPGNEKELDNLKGIDDKIDDFSKSIEVLDIEDAKKGEKSSDLKTLEAEERQIEAIGRLVAARRGQNLVLEKRSQKDLESKSIALDKDLVEFNFGNRFPTSNVERRGTVQRITKEDLARDRLMDKSLEVSETTFVRPPRVLSTTTTTTENIRKAIVNGKIFYAANLRNQRDITKNNITGVPTQNSRKDLLSSSTRKPKSLNLRPLEERAPSVISNANYGKKKVVRTRNVVNPVRKVKRVYRRKYNPDEVRRRLLDREKSIKESEKQ